MHFTKSGALSIAVAGMCFAFALDAFLEGKIMVGTIQLSLCGFNALVYFFLSSNYMTRITSQAGLDALLEYQARLEHKVSVVEVETVEVPTPEPDKSNHRLLRVEEEANGDHRN